MTKTPGKSAAQLSRLEETAISCAEAAVEELSDKYQPALLKQFETFSGHVRKQKWQLASDVAHIICGEAGTFQRPRASEVAVFLRDILQSSNPGAQARTIAVLQEGLGLLVHSDNEDDTEKCDQLMAGLQAVAVKSGSEARP